VPDLYTLHQSKRRLTDRLQRETTTLTQKINRHKSLSETLSPRNATPAKSDMMSGPMLMVIACVRGGGHVQTWNVSGEGLANRTLANSGQQWTTLWVAAESARSPTARDTKLQNNSCGLAQLTACCGSQNARAHSDLYCKPRSAPRLEPLRPSLGAVYLPEGAAPQRNQTPPVALYMQQAH
jgi:hypothetical protein